MDAKELRDRAGIGERTGVEDVVDRAGKATEVGMTPETRGPAEAAVSGVKVREGGVDKFKRVPSFRMGSHTASVEGGVELVAMIPIIGFLVVIEVLNRGAVDTEDNEGLRGLLVFLLGGLRGRLGAAASIKERYVAARNSAGTRVGNGIQSQLGLG